jgi:DNA-binding transcriptional LysR family regulator
LNNILTVMEFVAQGLGVGLLPIFPAQGHKGLRALSAPLDQCQTELWLLAHPEARHIRRVPTVFGQLAQQMALA